MTYAKLAPLVNSANFETVFIDTSVAESAADLRARYNLRTPDALQIAVAFEKGCEAFLQRWSAYRKNGTHILTNGASLA